MDEPVIRFEAGNIFFFYPDHQGSITHVANLSGLIEQYRYDAFGAPAIFNAGGGRLLASAINNRFLFTGREWAPAGLAFYEYRARTYHPGLGRFLTEDPKGFEAGDYNLFRYCKNDPVDHADPTGLFREDQNGNLAPETTNEFIQMANGVERGDVRDTRPIIDPIDVLSAGIASVLKSGLARTTASTVARETAISGLSKVETKLAAAKLGLPDAQAAGVRSAIGRATTNSSVTVSRSGKDISVSITRAGSDGYQAMQSVIAPDGTKTVIQKAFNSAGELVHVDVKTARSN